MHIAIVVGNPKPNSRTLNIARQVAREICDRLDGRIALEIDLALHTGSIFTWPNAEMAELNQAVARSDILVIASPTYKATYTGLLKAFLDRYPSNGLVGVTAVPVMTGASDLHSMAIETGLRPLLVELGASVPSRGLYFVMARIAEVDAQVRSWADQNLRPGGLIGPSARPVVQ